MAAGHALNFIEVIVGAENRVLATASLVAAGLVLLAFVARKRLDTARNPIIPDDKLTARNFAELVVTFILNLGDNVMGKENRKYLPFVGTLFFYIAVMNLIGLIPGFLMPTDTLEFNLGIGFSVFVLYNIWGIQAVGLVNYVKHLFGPVVALAPLIFVIELVSHAVRPVALSLRLFGNMLGDHLVLGISTDLTKIVIPVIFYFLGTFVCLIQAFVFTLLTMVYIRMAVAHDEDH